jgi:predicted RecB family nuclease
MRHILTERIFQSSFDCTYKCYLLFNGRRGHISEYERHNHYCNTVYQRAALSTLSSGKDTLYSARLTLAALHHRTQFLVIKRAEADGLRSESVVLARPSDKQGLLQPVYFNRYAEVNIKAKWLLAFRALIVYKTYGITPLVGRIISGRHFADATVSLSPLMNKLAPMISRLTELASEKDPSFFLCAHCEVCEFRQSCHARAVKEDSMSLIQGMGRSRIEEQNKKGIFNLFQYSHTFRTRRLPKRIKNPAKPRYFALQARALRDKKVYIHGSPTLSSSSPAIYYDIEGIPGHRLLLPDWHSYCRRSKRILPILLGKHGSRGKGDIREVLELYCRLSKLHDVSLW